MSAPSLVDDLVEQILVRLPPEDPASLVRASLVCKPWRRLLAGSVFRRRYREFHRRPHLLGFLRILRGDKPLPYYSRFVPTSIFRPAEPDLPDWLIADCRHGRALFVTTNPDIEGTLDLVVWDPMMDDALHLPQPSLKPEDYMDYTAAVLCATEGCHHCSCEEGPFRVAFLSTDKENGVTSARLYSSETGTWNELTSVHHPKANVYFAASVVVGDALYFRRGIMNHTIEYNLSTSSLSVIDGLAMYSGQLMTGEDGGLGFAAVDGTVLTLWSRETSPEAWTQRRVVDLKTLLPDYELVDSYCMGLMHRWIPVACVIGFAEGTDIIFVGTLASVYMIELNSGRVRKVLDEFERVYPYMSFYIPAMEAASTAEEPKGSV